MTRAIRLVPLVLVAALTTSAHGQPGGLDPNLSDITNSPHNINNVPGVQIPGNQVCLPCHVPHNAYPDAGTIEEVLWNHDETDAEFEMYTTRSGQQGGQPEGPSKMCLSCHDGVTAIDSYGGTSGTIMMGDVGDGQANLTTDLTDDHPIGIIYPDGDPGYNNSSGLQGVRVVTINGEDRVECTSCHEPHNNSLGHFLRANLEESFMCLQCHNK
jgi:predicted CXXCH cytochrome family protein